MRNYQAGTTVRLVEKAPSAFENIGLTSPYWEVPLAASAVTGDTAIALERVDVEVKFGDAITGSLIDLSGYTYRGQIRRSGDTLLDPIPSPLASFTFNTQQIGIAEYSLTNTQTTAIPANCTYDQLAPYVDRQLSLLDVEAGWAKLKKLAYRFNIESVSPAGIVARRLQGLAFVVGDVTV
jgi:hypothetical protein